MSIAGPAAPAMATPLSRSAGYTFSIVRWLMRLPLVARRSPAITTPSAYRTATTVVPCVIWMRSVMSTSDTCEGLPVRRSNSAKLGPGSSEAEKIGSVIGAAGYRLPRSGLLPALLHVRLDELFCVRLEHLVDLVQQIVE